MTELKAGRELDALVAEKVMGYQCVCDEPPGRIDCPVHNAEDRFTLLPYSTDIAVAWHVVEALISRPGWEFQVDADGAKPQWYAEFSIYARTAQGFVELQDAWDERAGTAPLAICLAALKAVGA